MALGVTLPHIAKVEFIPAYPNSMHPGLTLSCLSMKAGVSSLDTPQTTLWPLSSVPLASGPCMAMMMMENSQSHSPNLERPSVHRERKSNLGL